MSETAHGKRFTIAGRPVMLVRADIVAAMRTRTPEPIVTHFVVVEARRFPPKQVIGAVTGIDRADFTTHQARRTLMRLGFSVGRRAQTHIPEEADRRRLDAYGGLGLAGRLQELRGQWVAIQGADVLHAADSPQTLISWLSEHGQTAESVYRVPEDEPSATGLAPL